jgi:GT2 family glycosyltransferase
MTAKIERSKIGIAIAVFNAEDIIEKCIKPLYGKGFFIVVFDDGSTDATADILRHKFPDVLRLTGPRELWWAGATRSAVYRCLNEGCDYVVMLNPDVKLTAVGIDEMCVYSTEHPDTIVAPLIVDDRDPEIIAWAGASFGKVFPGLPIYSARYIARRGMPVSAVGLDPYSSDEVHGRGVVITRQIVEKIGMFDSDVFPHYGADNDYSLRARGAGIEIVIMPQVKGRLATENTGMLDLSERDFRERLTEVRAYLTDRKNGEALRIWWHLYNRHLPPSAVLPSYAAFIARNVYKRLFG